MDKMQIEEMRDILSLKKTCEEISNTTGNTTGKISWRWRIFCPVNQMLLQKEKKLEFFPGSLKTTCNQ